MNLRIGDHVYVVTENDNLSKIKGFVVKRLAIELDPKVWECYRMFNGQTWTVFKVHESHIEKPTYET